MSTSKVEATVKVNALKLDKKIDGFQQNAGQYVVFNGTEHFFSDSFGTAINQGDKAYGANSGFVVRKIGNVPSLSNLVKS